MLNDEQQGALRLLAAVQFMDDPLNTDIPIPDPLFWAAVDDDCTCKVPEGALHAEWCGCQGIYGKLCTELCIYPRTLWYVPCMESGNWLCSDGEQWHRMGEINGPDHWCEREGRFVTL